jgi:hypothetical protein
VKVLIACEFSGVVREAFRARGHDAWSCDVLPAEDGSDHHLLGDVRDYLYADGPSWSLRWDLMVAFPPCTHLAVSGARWFKDKLFEQGAAIGFVRALMDAPIHRIAIENPISIISSRIRKPDQIVQPWMFGHGETKATCLWLKNLPRLIPTHKRGDLFAAEEPTERMARVHLEPPGPDRWKNRSRTLQGIAAAMAEQWGEVGRNILPDHQLTSCRSVPGMLP